MSEEIKTEFKYIRFSQIADTGKTTKWCCSNIKHQNSLGLVVWDSAWRQYIFTPHPYCVFSAGCLTDIQIFIQSLMAERNLK